MASKQEVKDDNLEHMPSFIKNAPWYMKDKGDAFDANQDQGK